VQQSVFSDAGINLRKSNWNVPNNRKNVRPKMIIMDGTWTKSYTSPAREIEKVRIKKIPTVAIVRYIENVQFELFAIVIFLSLVFFL
jgi:hypothetical protein